MTYRCPNCKEFIIGWKSWEDWTQQDFHANFIHKNGRICETIATNTYFIFERHPNKIGFEPVAV